MNKFRVMTLALVIVMISMIGIQVSAQDDVTLRVLIHQNPPMVEFVESFNAAFEEANPNISIDLSVVNANDLATVTQTRLTAGDIDVIDIFGFSNSVQPYMADATPMGNATTMAPRPRQAVPTIQGKIPPLVIESMGGWVRNVQLMARQPFATRK